MKITLLPLGFIFLTTVVFGQPQVELQLGGANFIGASVNGGYAFKASQTKPRCITAYLGVGMLAPYWDGPTSIVHTGLEYNFTRLALGAETSHFFTMPIGKEPMTPPSVDLIAYPNISYRLGKPKGMYVKLSAGAYFAFSKSAWYGVASSKIRFEGDVIPGAGLYAGYRF